MHHVPKESSEKESSENDQPSFPDSARLPVPLPIDPATIEPLPHPLELTHCEVTLVDPFFSEGYLWLKVPEGFKMPMSPGETIKADVSFSPPRQ